MADDDGVKRDIPEILQDSSQEFLRMMRFSIDRSSEAVFWIGPDAKLFYVNDTACRELGYSRDELLTMTVHDIDPNFPPKAWKPHWDEIRKRGSFVIETLHRTRDGREIPVEVTVNYLAFGDREFNCAFAKNISERKRAEEALRKSESRLTNLLDNLPGMAYQCRNDPDWTMEFVSDGSMDLTGYKPSELIDNAVTSYADLINPEDRGEVWRQVQSALDEKGPFRTVYRITDKAGKERWVWEQGRGVFAEGGELMYLDGYIFDITARKKAEEGMEKLLTAVENSSDWILITDRQGTITYVNKAVAKIAGYEKDELLGVNPRIFKSGLHSSQFYEDLWNTLLSGRTFSGIVTNRRKDGELFEMYHTITPLKDSSGEISNFVATSKDMTQQKLMEDRINFLAYYDRLTGLPNRTLLMDRLKQAITRAKHHKRFVAVLSIDIDRFSLINDTYGARRGDDVLTAFGQRLLDNVREGDTVARLGSDEFGIAFVDMAHSEDIIVMLKKIMTIIRQPLNVEGEEIIATASIGISIYPDDAYDAESALQNANIAMLKVKKREMNNYLFFTPDINIKSSEFLRLEQNLYKALQNNEFVLHYQPYFITDTRQACGMEALIRWQSPDLGIVSPGEFIPVLEESRLIIDVGQWILATACKQLISWRDKGLEVVPVAVNFSSLQFRQKDFVTLLSKTIEEVGIEPGLITCEITESTFMEDMEFTRAALEDIENLGFSVNIDDFGTGYSSLSYLKRLPVTNLKIDISFIRHITEDPDDAAIVSTIISMAHNLGLKTIAEGVETEEQWKIMRLMRCDMIQGFYLSRPQLPEEVEKFLARKAAP